MLCWTFSPLVSLWLNCWCWQSETSFCWYFNLLPLSLTRIADRGLRLASIGSIISNFNLKDFLFSKCPKHHLTLVFPPLPNNYPVILSEIPVYIMSFMWPSLIIFFFITNSYCAFRKRFHSFTGKDYTISSFFCCLSSLSVVGCL